MPRLTELAIDTIQVLGTSARHAEVQDGASVQLLLQERSKLAFETDTRANDQGIAEDGDIDVRRPWVAVRKPRVVGLQRVGEICFLDLITARGRKEGSQGRIRRVGELAEASPAS